MYVPRNAASVAMAVSPLRSALSQRGLWIESLAAGVHKEGLESEASEASRKQAKVIDSESDLAAR